MTWADLERASGVPYETIRRVRTGDRPITKDVRDRLEDGLRWKRDSIRRILEGGDPIPLEGPTLVQEEGILNTPIGRAVYTAIREIDEDSDDLTDEERSELEEALAERLRTEMTLFANMKRAEIERRRGRRARSAGEG